jgi:hypothetical protein
MGEEDSSVPPLGYFDTDCLEGSGIIGWSDKFEGIAAEFGERRFKFGACGEGCGAAPAAG